MKLPLAVFLACVMCGVAAGKSRVTRGIHHLPQLPPLIPVPVIPVHPVPVRPIHIQPIPVQQIRPIPVQPIRPIPVQPIPVRPIPVQPIQPIPVRPIPMQPIQPIPVRPIPVYPVPVHPLPVVKPVPIHPVPVHQIPMHPVPVQQIPIHPVPVQQIPIHPVSIQQIPIHPVPVQQVPIQPLPVEPVHIQPLPVPMPMPFPMQQMPEPLIYKEAHLIPWMELRRDVELFPVYQHFLPGPQNMFPLQPLPHMANFDPFCIDGQHKQGFPGFRGPWNQSPWNQHMGHMAHQGGWGGAGQWGKGQMLPKGQWGKVQMPAQGQWGKGQMPAQGQWGNQGQLMSSIQDTAAQVRNQGQGLAGGQWKPVGDWRASGQILPADWTVAREFGSGGKVEGQRILQANVQGGRTADTVLGRGSSVRTGSAAAVNMPVAPINTGLEQTAALVQDGFQAPGSRKFR